MFRLLHTLLPAALLAFTACGPKKPLSPEDMTYHVAQNTYPEAVVFYDSENHGWNVVGRRFVREIAAAYDACSTVHGSPCSLMYQSFWVSNPQVSQLISQDPGQSQIYHLEYNHSRRLFSEKVNAASDGSVMIVDRTRGIGLQGDTPVLMLARKMGLGTRGGTMVIVVADPTQINQDHMASTPPQ